MAAQIKMVYVAVNSLGQTLYNKTLGTWNDGQKGRDGSSVWTFSARKAPEESSTMQKAKDWLEKLGHEGVEFCLMEVMVNGSKQTPTSWVPPVKEVHLPAIIDEAVFPITYAVAEEEDELSEALSNVA